MGGEKGRERRVRESLPREREREEEKERTKEEEEEKKNLSTVEGVLHKNGTAGEKRKRKKNRRKREGKAGPEKKSCSFLSLSLSLSLQFFLLPSLLHVRLSFVVIAKRAMMSPQSQIFKTFLFSDTYLIDCYSCFKYFIHLFIHACVHKMSPKRTVQESRIQANKQYRRWRQIQTRFHWAINGPQQRPMPRRMFLSYIPIFRDSWHWAPHSDCVYTYVILNGCHRLVK